MVFNRRVITILMLIFAGTYWLPLMAAQAGPRSDKDEKEMQAHEQTEEQEIAAFIKNIPDEIPFILPAEMQLIGDDGKPLEESLKSTDDESLEYKPYKDILIAAFNKKELPVIARVLTRMPDTGKLVPHYFDVHALRKEFEIGGRGYRNPFNRQPIVQLTYAVYIPEMKHFFLASKESNPSHLLSIPQIQEAALHKAAVIYDEMLECFEKARRIYSHLNKTATDINVRNRAQVNLARCLYYGTGGDQDLIQARLLLEPFAKAAGELGLQANILLACGYYDAIDNQQWLQDDERALAHGLSALKNGEFEKFYLKGSQAKIYGLVGELLTMNEEHPEAPAAFGYLKKAVQYADATDDVALKTWAYMQLARGYYTSSFLEEVKDRYEQAWKYSQQALQHYEYVKDNPDFLIMLAEMNYYALGNAGNVKKGLAYIQEYEKQYHFITGRLQAILAHNDYYRRSEKEPAKKKEALRALQEMINIHGHDDAIDLLYYTKTALLGEMYQHEAECEREQAQLHAATDPDHSYKCNRLADDLDKRAEKIFDAILTKMPRFYRSSYAWALTHLVVARREIRSPSKNYEKASSYLRQIFNERREFPLLASNARALLSDIQSKVSLDFELDFEGDDLLHPKDPRYYEMQFKNAMNDFNTVTLDADGLEPFFTKICNRFKLVANKSSNILLKGQAQEALRVSEWEWGLIGQVRDANENTDEGRASKRLAMVQLAQSSRSKSIQDYYQRYLKEEDAEHARVAMPLTASVASASLSLDASLDAPVSSPLAMPAPAGLVPMDARPDDEQRRGVKRKAGEPLADPRARGAEQSNGAGSRSA